MSLRVAIFEDDKELVDVLKIMMEEKFFVVHTCYSLKDSEWKKSDVVLGDFRNEIVKFEELKNECQKENIPLIAISGMETTYRPQILKPFIIDEVQSIILQELVRYNKIVNNQPKTKEKSFFKKIFGLS